MAYDPLQAKRKALAEIAEFARGGMAQALKSKYAPKPPPKAAEAGGAGAPAAPESEFGPDALEQLSRLVGD